jgi:hypothetical protein
LGSLLGHFGGVWGWKCGKCHTDSRYKAIECGFYQVDWRWKARQYEFYHTDVGVLRTRKVRA